mgnify:CR=1 FL=1
MRFLGAAFRDLYGGIILYNISSEELKILKKMVNMAHEDRTIMFLQPTDIGLGSNTTEKRIAFKKILKKLKEHGLIESYNEFEGTVNVENVIMEKEAYNKINNK